MPSGGVVLEMNDPRQLVPAPTRADVRLSQVDRDDVPRFATLYRTIWAPLGGGGRVAWGVTDWRAELARPGTEAWIATLGGDDVGMAQIGWSGRGDAGFTVIGVIPACQGQGIGGDLLTRLTRRLWEHPAPNGRATHRVWLWTLADEHPHTIPSYLARGYRRGPDLVD
ncbi:GNAT family N-acetyltransferase [Desertihabitans aurantiacus]|uniref:GNAT family N-acetyltransferase n=1 Tax=Desertihabitans aurantiacus TaxID=2282477 RepID=UPI00130063CE|nr:GNAT family N-acetyltransferase [Desertihabitans aurantiacus]